MATRLNLELVSIGSPDHYAVWNPLSIQTIAGDVRGMFGDKVSVRLHKLNSSDEAASLARNIFACNPQIIGLSPELGSLEVANAFIRDIHSMCHVLNQFPMLVFGNKLPTYYPELFVEKCKGSIVVRGEGEESMRGLVEHCLEGRPLETIPNLVYNNANGTLTCNGCKKPELDKLIYPPAIDLLEVQSVNGNSALVQSSRGCSWGECSYCTVKSFRHGKKWEGLPVKRVLETIKQSVEVGIKEFEFADDDFLGGNDRECVLRADELVLGFKEIRKRYNANLKFRVFLLPTTIYREHRTQENINTSSLLLRLKDAGLARVYFGVESGNASQLKRYQRGATVRDVEGALATLIQSGIDIDVGFIMFDPDVTLDEVAANISFFKKWGLIHYNQWPFRPLALNKGAKLYDRLKDSDCILGEDINFMKCNYRFSDRRVQHIAQIVDFLSNPTASLFYALKQKTKARIARENKNTEAELAQVSVEDNGMVYLDLMEWLCKNVKSVSGHGLEAAVKNSLNRIYQLVHRIQHYIDDGKMTDLDGYLRKEIEHSRLNPEEMWKGLKENIAKEDDG